MASRPLYQVSRWLARRLPCGLRSRLRLLRWGHEPPDLIDLPEPVRELPGERVAVIAPHPDDEAIGCGGVLSLYRQRRVPTTVLYLTDGECGDNCCDLRGDALTAERRAETAVAAHRLGLVGQRFLGFPDGSVRCDRSSVRRVRHALDSMRPDVLFIPSCGEGHRDHRAAFWLAAAAVRRYRYPLEIFVYEVWSPLRANCVVPIDFTAKAEAIRAYASQMDEQERYVGASDGLNRYRAATALLDGATHAEAFWRGAKAEFLRASSRSRRAHNGAC